MFVYCAYVYTYCVRMYAYARVYKIIYLHMHTPLYSQTHIYTRRQDGADHRPPVPPQGPARTARPAPGKILVHILLYSVPVHIVYYIYNQYSLFCCSLIALCMHL